MDFVVAARFVMERRIPLPDYSLLGASHFLRAGRAARGAYAYGKTSAQP